MALRTGKGREEPRIWTRPLRPLTPATTHGFHVIEFALVYLGVTLRPWQKWLLIHALELNEDGTYRFRKVVIIVGRQNGKTKLIEVLATWWLFVDSQSFPDHIPAHEFLVLGSAQDRDTAKKVWRKVLDRSNPEVLRWPDRFTPAERAVLVPVLAKQARTPTTTNGSEAIRLANGARYEIAALASGGSRGDSTARAIIDELRQQTNWDGWAAFSKTLNGTFNSQLWAISSAGDARSVVLADLRAAAIATCAAWDDYVAKGLQSVEDFANEHDTANGIFEWSAHEDAAIDDPAGYFQSNPSIGFGYNVDQLLSDLASGEPEAVTKTEVLCQWVQTLVTPYLLPADWAACADGPSESGAGGSRIVPGTPIALGVDTSTDRKMTYLSAAGWREDGLPHIEVIAQSAGMLWLAPLVEKVAQRRPVTAIGLQPRGCPAGEFAVPLQQLGLPVFEVGGSHLGAAVGQLKDRVEAHTLRHRAQPALDLSASGTTARKVGEVFFLDRDGSAVDAAVLISASNALYGLVHAGDVLATSHYEDHGLVVA
ncbi:hypothetical protein [Rathayibacter sp. VKM Ac-2630]|uniref:hypothetical protein n=1 Tax=Rathayibacter sp. VKM Ac-2630 TaxID=1938617 RepID=UPI00098171A1|nr:hypothetical protein [Rathayibacter sp. VKM Ac-2630]OOB90737.1 hypothetical protein B0T42_10035 [Rathayibacter sp. VKM Ac-2630]